MAKDDPRVEIFVLCDTALVSKDNKLSVIGIFDRIVTDKIPFNFPKMVLVAVISGRPRTTHSLRLTILDPSDKEVAAINMQVDMGATGTSNLISEITNFPLVLTGAYKVTLHEEKKELANRFLNVNKTTEKTPLAA